MYAGLRALAYGGTVVAVVAVVAAGMGYCDKIVPRVDVIASDPDLVVFHADALTIEPLTLDVDTNELQYRFVGTQKDQQVLLAKIDVRAAREGWRTEQRSATERVFAKKLSGQTGGEQVVVVRSLGAPGSLEVVRSVRARPHKTERRD